LIIDSQTRSIITIGRPDDLWAGGTFDPGGALVTDRLGVLSLRDGTTGALIARLPSVPAVSPAIAPDGSRLAFIETDVGATNGGVGIALRTAQWSARDAQLGESQVLVAPSDSHGIEDPRFSPDSRWIAYTVTTGTTSVRPRVGTFVIPASGGAPIELSSEPGDSHPHWVSDLAPSRFDGAPPTPLAWLAFESDRAIGGRTTPTRQLWVLGFAPDAGVVTPPVHLPGQPNGFFAIHAPARIR
jgi:hypothetical protein